VRLSIRPVTLADRDYNDVIERYPRLYVSADFAKSVSSWIQVLISKPCMAFPSTSAYVLGVLYNFSNLEILLSQGNIGGNGDEE
jgi:hypothetical protein